MTTLLCYTKPDNVMKELIMIHDSFYNCIKNNVITNFSLLCQNLAPMLPEMQLEHQHV